MQNLNHISIISINPGHKTTGAFECSLSTGMYGSDYYRMDNDGYENPWDELESSFLGRNILKIAKKAVNLCRLCRGGR